MARNTFIGYVPTKKVKDWMSQQSLPRSFDIERQLRFQEPAFKAKAEKLGCNPYDTLREIYHDGIEMEFDDYPYFRKETLEDFISDGDISIRPAQVNTMINWMVEEGLLEGVK